MAFDWVTRSWGCRTNRWTLMKGNEKKYKRHKETYQHKVDEQLNGRKEIRKINLKEKRKYNQPGAGRILKNGLE